ncbi:right-handed parallel beta-helix repeat-containing protein [Vibrio ziniensis]|uniref:Exopolygalacturonate lyase n=1 Tax=Vibrio ziniensis TaxID=2711221 RepID=A0A6G7CPU0_9VIBR|nr:exopolygalacturonate lyase [Vibrio ziniensis]QIH44099.1 exopolygalacturonate lyase [Vibrio ziniensis]QOT69933.1 pectate disaccharide-lyase [Vibrio ziniensis]
MQFSKITLAVSSVLALGACSSTTNNPDELTWQAVTFGQSTDLNFGSTILPEKVGTNEVLVNGKPVQRGKVAESFTIESRGGKLANSHEGGTFYYTKLPTSKNFTLSATIVLEQLGPETGSAPNRQEGAGIMVRDIIGEPRQNPQPEGLEEFPAASNMVINLLRANKKEHNGLVNIDAQFRDGIYQPWGTGGNRMSRNEFIKGIPFTDGTPFKMSLTRTNSGYIVSYDNGSTVNTHEVKNANANIVEMQDPDNQYVGFFASRNAKIAVSDVKLEISDASTIDAPKYSAKLQDVVLQQASPDRSTIANYSLQSRANYAGTFTVSREGNTLIDKQSVNAGDFFKFDTSLNAGNNEFSVTYTPSEGPDLTSKTYQQLVEKVVLPDPMNISVNPDGSNGNLDLETAIKLVAPGGIITLEDGDYQGITIPVTVSGTAEAPKTLVAKGNNVRFIGDIQHNASYWNVSNLEVAGARYIVWGSYNNFSHIVTHGAQDTGFQITSPDKLGRALWASHNIVSDSESYNNMDDSQINADGFAAKMRIGDGNTFIRCVSHHNIDDGWDLFNKVEDGANGVVTILDSIAYKNGQTLTVDAKGGTRGNGFKLGGEGLPVAHVVKNSLAFQNNMDGFTDNFNPGSLVLENNTSIDNTRFNFLFRKSPYTEQVKQGSFEGNRSYRFFVASKYSDVVNGDSLVNNHFYVNGNTVDQAGKVVQEDVSLLKNASEVTSIDDESLREQVQKVHALLN